MTGVRYSGEIGHPFHVVDDDFVILALDHPFIAEGRFASLLVRDKGLTQQLADGFQSVWSKAMKDLREIQFDRASMAPQAFSAYSQRRTLALYLAYSSPNRAS